MMLRPTMMLVAPIMMLGSANAEELEACPNEQLDCRAAGETCGYMVGESKVALCSDGLFCQSAEVIPSGEIASKYMGTCVTECAENHLSIDFGVCAPVCFVEDDLEPKENWLWVGHEEHVTADQCNSKCKCDATTGTMDCPDTAPCKPASPSCKPLSNKWKDSQENSCDWYEADALRCLAFGDRRLDADGIGANQACCVCGGGKKETDGQFVTQKACPLGGAFVEDGMVLYTDACGSNCECGMKASGWYEWTCTRGEQCPATCEDQKTMVAGVEQAWVDVHGNTCEWYTESPVRCLAEYPGQYDNLRAAQACCACGGLEKAETFETPAENKGESSDNTVVIAAAAGAGAFAIAFFVMLGCYCKTKSQLDEYKRMEVGPEI